MKTIHFTETSNFLGRNGMFKSIGLFICRLTTKDEIRINPVTSKNKMGMCSIYVPISNIPELIDTLKSFMEGSSENKKEIKIKRIKDILSVWGGTTTSELELGGSPCISSTGTNKNNVSVLIEEFYPDGVKTVTYQGETEIDECNVRYEGLSDDLIDEIADIINNYETDMLKTEKRCQN